jgi:hypothetical protein
VFAATDTVIAPLPCPVPGFTSSQDVFDVAVHVQSRAASRFSVRLDPVAGTVGGGVFTAIWHRTGGVGPITCSVTAPPQAAVNSATPAARHGRMLNRMARRIASFWPDGGWAAGNAHLSGRAEP